MKYKYGNYVKSKRKILDVEVGDVGRIIKYIPTGHVFVVQFKSRKLPMIEEDLELYDNNRAEMLEIESIL